MAEYLKEETIKVVYFTKKDVPIGASFLGLVSESGEKAKLVCLLQTG